MICRAMAQPIMMFPASSSMKNFTKSWLVNQVITATAMGMQVKEMPVIRP